ncbi:MAG: hypothetical protein HQK52_23775 [Oligoflexia bacterium]|nr:hypothetical protein [Oligoflexia bacterium]
MNKTLSAIVLLSIGLLSSCNHGDSSPDSNPAPTIATQGQTKCPDNLVYDNDHKVCVENCGSDMRFDFSFWKCVPSEPIAPVVPIIPTVVVAPIETPMVICTGNSYLDPATKKCIQGLPLLMFEKELSILPNLLFDKNPEVCVDISKQIQSSMTEEDMQVIISKIQNSIETWINPLSKDQSISVRFVRNIPVHVELNSECNHNNWTATIHIVTSSDLAEFCGNYGRECAKLSQIWLTKASRFSTYLHEFGHLMGFEDHYIEGKYGCKKGYDINTTIMCVNDEKLMPADIEGIKRQYCRFWSDAIDCQENELKKLTDFDNGTFITCGNNKVNYEIVNDYHQIRFITRYWFSDRYDWSPPHNLDSFLLVDELNHYPWVIKSATATDKLTAEVDFANDKVIIDYGNLEHTVVEFSIKKDCDISNDFLHSRIKSQFPGLL